VRTKGIVLFGLLSSLILSCATPKPMLESQPLTRVEFRLASGDAQAGFLTMILPETEESVYVSPEVILSNNDIRNARYIQDVRGAPAVEIQFTQVGKQKFADFTSAHVGEMAAILVDGQVTATPTIRAAITNGLAVINGRFTESEAKAIASSIVSGK